MTRPVFTSVYSESAAYTSAIRLNKVFSSSDNEAQGRTLSPSMNVPGAMGFNSVSSVSPRQHTLFDHAREHPFPIRLVAVVKLALVLFDVLLRRVMWCVVGAGAVPHVPGLVGSRLLGVADELNCLVGYVF